MPLTEEERIARIHSLSMNSTVRELIEVVAEVFQVHFGITPDATRMKDIEREASEFSRALSRVHRIEELGDLFSSLLAFVFEQEADLVAAIKKTLFKIEGRAAIYAALGDKKNIAILGTAADPPTVGHLALARAVLNSQAGIHEVWIMPPGDYAGAKNLTKPHHRAAMCRLLERADRRIKFFGFEIDNRLGGETLHTMLRLMADTDLQNRHRFHFAITTETAVSVSTWTDADQLKRAVTFITAPRPGYAPNLQDPWFLQQPHVYLGDAQGLVEVSSTDVRRAIAANDWDRAEKLVTPEILEYIREHRLYSAAA